MTVPSRGRFFFDTNVLVYADDESIQLKQLIAIELIERHQYQGSGVVSTQVLQEYFTTVTRKLNLDPALAREKVAIFSYFDVVIPTPTDILAAIDLHRLHHFSFWDGLILRAAQLAGCRTLFSEDMQHGRRIDGIEIVNPFV
jgi:predicted nucleic acid-binding protein